MSQRAKNLTLLAIAGLLILCSVVLALKGEKTSNTIENKEMFMVSDTSSVDQISIATAAQKIVLKKQDGVWILNDKYKAEQNIVRVLLSIVKSVEVMRNVPKSQANEIANDIKNNGYYVELLHAGKQVKSFYAKGNDTKTMSYLMPADSDNPRVVNIPGYESYVAGIFEISANDWRNRTILNTNWRTLQQMDVKYAQFPEYDFSIEFKFNFLNVAGIDRLDTARMMAYVDQFSFLQADQFIDQGEKSGYDNLLNSPKTVSISIKDINPDNSKTIEFYPLLPDDPMMLGFVKEEQQMVLFQASRIQSLFAVKEEFEAK